MDKSVPKDRPEVARNKIIVALDVSSLREAEDLVEDLAPYVGFFKVGLELITAVGGPQAVHLVHSFGGQVFYDGKFADIPNTVGAASRAVADMGVKMFNVHASAGRKSVEAAVANSGAGMVLGVTVLTSIAEEECISIFGDKPGVKVLQFARMLAKANANGIICSPQELELLGKQPELDDLLKVTPGIRSKFAPADDQKRTRTPTEAIVAGATHLVIGRPITKSPNPVEAAKRILEEINDALICLS